MTNLTQKFNTSDAAIIAAINGLNTGVNSLITGITSLTSEVQGLRAETRANGDVLVSTQAALASYFVADIFNPDNFAGIEVQTLNRLESINNAIARLQSYIYPLGLSLPTGQGSSLPVVLYNALLTQQNLLTQAGSDYAQDTAILNKIVDVRNDIALEQELLQQLVDCSCGDVPVSNLPPWPAGTYFTFKPTALTFGRVDRVSNDNTDTSFDEQNWLVFANDGTTSKTQIYNGQLYQWGPPYNTLPIFLAAPFQDVFVDNQSASSVLMLSLAVNDQDNTFPAGTATEAYSNENVDFVFFWMPVGSDYTKVTVYTRQS